MAAFYSSAVFCVNGGISKWVMITLVLLMSIITTINEFVERLRFSHRLCFALMTAFKRSGVD